jgi:phage repressor protein C with HTH and peptisase S24 domain
MSTPALQDTIEIVDAGTTAPEVDTTRVVPSVMPFDLVQRVIGTTARVRLHVRGTSMRPALRSGDRITLAALHRPPERGDVVAVRADGGLVVRRYGEEPDEAVVGLVVAAERGGRPIEIERGAGAVGRAVAAGTRRSLEILRRMAG